MLTNAAYDLATAGVRRATLRFNGHRPNIEVELEDEDPPPSNGGG